MKKDISKEVSQHFSKLGKRSWEVRKTLILNGKLKIGKKKNKLSTTNDNNVLDIKRTNE